MSITQSQNGNNRPLLPQPLQTEGTFGQNNRRSMVWISMNKGPFHFVSIKCTLNIHSRSAWKPHSKFLPLTCRILQSSTTSYHWVLNRAAMEGSHGWEQEGNKQMNRLVDPKLCPLELPWGPLWQGGMSAVPFGERQVSRVLGPVHSFYSEHQPFNISLL